MDGLKNDMLFLVGLLSDRANALDGCIVDPGQYLALKKLIQELIDMLTGGGNYVYKDNLLLLNPHEFESNEINLKTIHQGLLDEILQIFGDEDINKFIENNILDISKLPNEIAIKISNAHTKYYFDDYKKKLSEHIEQIINNIGSLQNSELNTTKTIQLKRLITEFLKKSISIFNGLEDNLGKNLFRVFIPIDDFIIIKNNKVIFRFGIGKKIHFIKEEDLEKFNSGKLDNKEGALYIADQINEAPDIGIKIGSKKEFICYLNNTKYSLEELENLGNFEGIKDLIEKFLLGIDNILQMNI